MTTTQAPPVWTEPFQVRAQESGPDGLVGPAGLANYLQTAAARHADALGVSIDRLQRAGLGWGLIRLWMELPAPPRTGQRITVRTWPSASGRLALNRDFEVMDETGQLLARAVSQWITFDLASRRVARLADFITTAFIRDTPPCLGFPTKSLTGPQNPPEVDRFIAGPEHLDSNGHVNNAFLINWAERAAPFGADFRPTAFDMAFKAECRLGDEVISLCQAESQTGTARQSLVRTADKRTLALAASTWVER